MLPLSTRVTSPRVLRSRYDLYEIASVNGTNNVVSGISPGHYGPSASVTAVIGPVSANVGTGIGTSQAVCNDRVAPGVATLSGCVATCGTVAINSLKRWRRWYQRRHRCRMCWRSNLLLFRRGDCQRRSRGLRVRALWGTKGSGNGCR